MNSIKLHDVVFAMMMISLTKILKKSLNLRETRFSRFRNMIRVTSEQKNLASRIIVTTTENCHSMAKGCDSPLQLPPF